MYPCSKCHRTYRTQNSLTRHAHSHRSDRKHQCTTCGVVFYRKDLLTRHSKLHYNPSNGLNRTSASEDDVGTGSRRQRCHTACDRCRETRTRCNGQDPCHTCSRAALTCHYSRRSNRLSHLPRPTETASDDHSPSTPSKRQGQSGFVDLPYQHLSTRTGETETLGNVHNHLDFENIAQLDSGSQQDYRLLMDCSLPDAALPTESSTFLNLLGDDSTKNTVTWPWLHEDLFLPANPSFLALPLDNTVPQAFRNTEYVDTDLGPSAIAPALPPENLCVQPGESTNLCQAANQFMVGRNAPTGTPLPESFEAGPAMSSTVTASQNILSESAGLDPSAASNSRVEQSRIVQDLVAFASASPSVTATKSNGLRARFWKTASTKVAHAFKLPYDEGSSTPPALYHFCNQYLDHFAPLWPLLSRHLLDFDSVHPVLFLVLTSIGAMYSGSQASNYGVMMHTHIRGILTMAIELEDDEHDFMSLAQARLLTQVAALYFGQPKAFTYAHHLGALLVAQARRNNLFSAVHASKTLRRFEQLKGIASDEERFGLWLQLESRRRLAFGIFRGDTYTSTLLHTKPLISMDEIDLWLPTCDSVWRGENMSASLCLQMIEHDQTPSRDLWASDIFRIAMDRNEPLPPLDSSGHELLMFGLQYPIWRFSKDREMFVRLTGDTKGVFNHDVSVLASEVNTTSSINQSSQSTKRANWNKFNDIADSEAYHLESAVRQMEDLQQERERLLCALTKWERNLPLVKTFVRTNLDRSSLMSSLILFHLGFIRLLVPLEELHQIQYRMADNKDVDDSLINTVRNWASSRQGRIAAERACNIWSIIAKESDVEKKKRVRFNLLAFIGLHHGAVLLWAYAAAKDCSDPHASPLTLRSSNPVLVDKSQSANLLSSFVDLYDMISPAQWSSFAKATSMLSSRPFPQTATV